MGTRSRLLALLGGVVLVAGAVVMLRATEEPAPDTPDRDAPPPVRIDRFAADYVVAPGPGDRPEPPRRVEATPDTGSLRVAWADALPDGSGPDGGLVPDGAAGYEVRLLRDGGHAETRLVVAPEVQFDDLTDGQQYLVEVRTVDSFGQRSDPVATAAVPGAAPAPWRDTLTGLFDDFAEPGSVLAETAGSHWHLSGYRGCVDLGPGPAGTRGLPIDLGCGADLAVLRARAPMRLEAPGPDGVLGRVAVRTDTAGPGGELTVDLVPGTPDRVGVDVVRASRSGERDPALPGGTIRVAVDDTGARVVAAPDVPAVSVVSTPELETAPRRGPGVAHLFEIVLTTGGVLVYQDEMAVAVGGVVPSWQQASMLLGFRGPDGRRSRVHVSAAGFSGPATAVAPLAEVRVNPGTQRILGLDEQAPSLGIARTPLVSAASARLVATLTITDEFDSNGVVAQFGDLRVPAHPAVPVPPTTPGAALTVIADVPAALLGARGADSVTPFVLRAPGTSAEVELVESYLEITPGPGWRAPATSPATPRPDPTRSLLPLVDAELANAAGDSLPNDVVPARGQVVVNIMLTATATQWHTGAVAGVRGLQVRLDGELVAGIPTAEDGPGLGGSYAVSIALAGLSHGRHVLEVREYAMDATERPVSTLLDFTVR